MSIRIAAVSYLNTKPFIYGLLRSPLSQEIEIVLAIPSECARMLKTGEVDLALAPVAIIPELEQAYIASEYCIGAFGKVGTVAIYSELPIDQIDAIWMDFHSKTSVALAKVICAHHLHIKPEYWPATEGFQEKIGGKVAGLVIGDKTIGLENRFPYVYDLAELWLNMTGLPFVFAAWMSMRPLDPDFIQQLNLALADGIDRIPELVKVLPEIQHFDLEHYYKSCISYPLDEAKQEALALFMSHLSPEHQIHIQFQQKSITNSTD
jgi:chorismate dehydratase